MEVFKDTVILFPGILFPEFTLCSLESDLNKGDRTPPSRSLCL